MQVPTSRRVRMAWFALGGAVGLAATVAATAYSIPGETARGPAPRFVEETATAGVDMTYQGGFEFFVGGGVADFDCNQDALPDLFVAGGDGPAGLFVNVSEPGGPIKFERSEGAGRPTAVTGAYPLLLDGDDHVDLVVLRVGKNLVLRGLGDCAFEEADERWGFDGGGEWTTAFSAAWAETDELPTLAFGNYLRIGATGDRVDQCEPHMLLSPATGEGYRPPASLEPGWCTLSMLFSDWGRNGVPDLRATNDRHYTTDGHEQLWNVFESGSAEAYDVTDGWQALRIWGMGIASHDLDADGFPEVFLTSQGDNKLQTLVDGPDRPSYRNISLEAGVTAHRPFTGDDVYPSTAWHADFEDVNDDGWMDLFIAKGNVSAQEGFALEDPNNLLLGDPSGTFVEAAPAAGTAHMASARGASIVDLNADGLLDLVTVNREEPVSVWRNIGMGTADRPEPIGHHLAVEARQTPPNVGAVGARVQVDLGNRMIEREVVVGGGHAGGSWGPLHFGLGDKTKVRVRVIWPDGSTTAWTSTGVDRTVVIDRSAGLIPPGG